MLWVAWPPPLFIHHALLSTLIGPLVSQLTPELREMPLSDWWIFWHLRWDKSHSGSLLAAHTRPGHSSMASHFSHLPRVLRSYTIVTIVWNKCEKLMHFIAVQCCRDQFVLLCIWLSPNIAILRLSVLRREDHQLLGSNDQRWLDDRLCQHQPPLSRCLMSPGDQDHVRTSPQIPETQSPINETMSDHHLPRQRFADKSLSAMLCVVLTVECKPVFVWMSI